jgi:hypothetical protein
MVLKEDEIMFLDEVLQETEESYNMWIEHMEQELSLTQVR